ncbi:amino acid permease-domain-containing protein [Stachybotrys elegans]|uniref:Amino acid permease-domain-containing protein n=1 Tax=Stachybotrys elegans TaxID=80388 RepID=A0A8K0WTL0_9HYPO|nr:amino acid permease-domain-containing protein [Stachybotrys elegans]
MNDFPASMGGTRHPPPAPQDVYDSDQEDLYALQANPNAIVTRAPKERFRLSLFDVTCLVLNRTIGTGIFNSPQRVMRGTGSPGASLLLWLLGSIYCLSGAHVYAEYGLNVPRYTIDGRDQSVARSGGDLNYLEFVYPYPRRDSVLFFTTLFGIAFIVLGNMAGNCISFGLRVLQAADVQQPSDAAVRGIAIATALLTCFIHTFSRRGGIMLSNVLAIVKVLILLFIVVTAICVAAGALPQTTNQFSNNTQPSTSFSDPGDINGFSQAFLAIIFSFSGFEQPNYVLGEVRRPRRYPIAMFSGVSTIILLYMAVNLSYMVVVPRETQIDADGGVAQAFFELSLGSISSSSMSGHVGRRIFHAMLAISSLGNIIVMTYTATRIKQEVAKLGILPFSKFFGQNTDLSFGRLLRWFQRKGYLSSMFRLRWFSPEHHSEKTPVGALILHFCCCLILILATWDLKADDAYVLLTSVSSYTINGVMGTFLGLGILILRFRGPPSMSMPSGTTKSRRSWAEITGSRFNPVLSIFCATLYMVGNLWPVVANWIRPGDDLIQSFNWWLAPTIGWAVLGFAIAWFIGFSVRSWIIGRKRQQVFIVEKQPEFDESDGGGLVLVHETVYMSWVGKETLHSRRPFEAAQGDEMAEQAGSGPNTFKGTDFDGFFQQQQQSRLEGGYDGFRRM